MTIIAKGISPTVRHILEQAVNASSEAVVTQNVRIDRSDHPDALSRMILIQERDRSLQEAWALAAFLSDDGDDLPALQSTVVDVLRRHLHGEELFFKRALNEAVGEDYEQQALIGALEEGLAEAREIYAFLEIKPPRSYVRAAALLRRLRSGHG